MMRDIKTIVVYLIIILAATFIPFLIKGFFSLPIHNLLSYISLLDILCIAYACISELQFLVCSGLIVFILWRFHTQSKICRWGLVIAYAALLFVLILSVKDAAPSKIEICIYSALYLLFGVYICKQAEASPSTPDMKKDAPPEQLGRTRYYRSAIRLIRKCALLEMPKHDQRKAAFAILGPWGSGKTHFIQHLIANLSLASPTSPTLSSVPQISVYEGRFRICEVSLWKCKTPEEAWVDIINALYSTVTDTNGRKKISELPGTLLTILLRIGGIFSPDLNSLNSIIGLVSKSGEYDVERKAAIIDEKLGNERAFLILEDADRASYDIIKNLLPLIEKLKKISKLSIICSMDVEEMEKLYSSQGADVDTMRGYLFKVFDYTFLLPDMPQEMQEVKMRISAKTMYPECRLLNMFVNDVKLSYDTPRQMERMLDEWASMERNFFLIPENSGIDEYTKKDVFVYFVAKAMSVCAPARTKELLEFKDFTAEYVPLIPQTSTVEAQGILLESCIGFFKEHGTMKSFFRDAIAQKYARRIAIKDFECADLIEKSLKKEAKGIEKLLEDYFKDEPLEKNYRNDAAYYLLDYAVTRFGRTSSEEDREKYYRFLLSVIKKAKPSNLIHDKSPKSTFTIHYETFENCVGALLENSKKYEALVNSIFGKLSYHNQAVACLRMHLVYGNKVEKYYTREDKSLFLKIAYQERESDEYKKIIRTYVRKYAERYCEFLVTPVEFETSFASSEMLYLYMVERFKPSLTSFNDGIKEWMNEQDSRKAKVLCGYIRHLLTKVYIPIQMHEPELYIPKGVIEKLPSVFELFDNIDQYSPEEQQEISETIQKILPKLQDERQNPWMEGVEDIIEKMQSFLSSLQSIQ